MFSIIISKALMLLNTFPFIHNEWPAPSISNTLKPLDFIFSKFSEDIKESLVPVIINPSLSNSSLKVSFIGVK